MVTDDDELRELDNTREEKEREDNVLKMWRILTREAWIHKRIPKG